MIVKIKNNTFKAKVAKTPKQITNGMGFKLFNENFNAMLFMLEDGNHCFWMKNCIIPLDIIFIRNNQITKIFPNCQPCTNTNCNKFCGEADIVLEVESGICQKLNIKEKDNVKIF